MTGPYVSQSGNMIQSIEMMLLIPWHRWHFELLFEDGPEIFLYPYTSRCTPKD